MIEIAIDGTAASGKGTLAKKLASKYGFPHLDTGLLYRKVAFELINKKRLPYRLYFCSFSECTFLVFGQIDLAKTKMNIQKSYAAIAAILSNSEEVHPMRTIWTDLDIPISIGPITVAPPSSPNIFVEMEAEWIAGMTNTLALSLRREKGYMLRTSLLSATSAAISPSNSKSTQRCSKILMASRTYLDLSPSG